LFLYIFIVNIPSTQRSDEGTANRNRHVFDFPRASNELAIWLVELRPKKLLLQSILDILYNYEYNDELVFVVLEYMEKERCFSSMEPLWDALYVLRNLTAEVLLVKLNRRLMVAHQRGRFYRAQHIHTRIADLSSSLGVRMSTSVTRIGLLLRGEKVIPESGDTVVARALLASSRSGSEDALDGLGRMIPLDD
jgi:hypothetical protein